VTEPAPPSPAHREAEELAGVARLLSETLDLKRVGERIAASVVTLLRADSAALRLLRPDGSLEAIVLGGTAKTFADVRAVVPAGFGNIGRAALEGRPVWSADVRTDPAVSPAIRRDNLASGIIANLAVPLRVAGRVIGALSVGSAAPRTFTKAEIGLLQGFADQAAIALHHAQTQQTLARQAERLRIMHQIDRALIAEQAPLAIAEAVVGPLRELLEVPRVIVNLFDLETGQVEWLAAAGRRRIHSGPGIRYSIRLAGDVEALRRGEPQVIDVHTLGPTPEANALLASGVNVYMVVPMIAGGELIGSVSLGDVARPFPPERVAIAQEVAA
jgi:GAF domain-containing protein